MTIRKEDSGFEGKGKKGKKGKSEFGSGSYGSGSSGGYYGGGGYYEGYEGYGEGGSWGGWYSGGYAGAKETGKSASSFWSERYGSWTSSYTTPDHQLREILMSVARAANVPMNDIEGRERSLSVKWSNGQEKNTLKDDLIYLSPDVVDDKTTRRKDWHKDELTDVLIADALSLATMKRTASEKSESLVSKGEISGLKNDKAIDTVRKMASTFFETTETLISERELLKDYPGFAPYFGAYRDYWTDSDFKKTVEDRLGTNPVKGDPKNKPDLAATMAAIQHEMMYPDRQLEVAPFYRKAIDAAKQKLRLDAKATERGGNDVNAAQQLFETMEQVSEEQPQYEPDDKNTPKGGMGPKGQSKNDSNTKGEGEDESEKRSSGDAAKTGAKKNRDSIPLGGLPHNLDNENSFKGGTENVHVKSDASDKSRYLKDLIRLRPLITAVRNRIKIRNEVPQMYEHGLRRGQLDDGSLYKLGMGSADPKIFEEKEIPHRMNLAFGILVDESGSMGCGNRSKIAKETCIILANALHEIQGVTMCVMGHTAQGHSHSEGSNDGMVLHHYYTPENKDFAAMGKISSFSENLDGYAMMEMARNMTRWYPQIDHRYLFVVSDGQPCGCGYGGESSWDHMRSVVKAAKNSNVRIFGVGIDNAYSEEEGNKMYGERNFIVLDDVRKSLTVISNFIVKVIRESCVMVG